MFRKMTSKSVEFNNVKTLFWVQQKMKFKKSSNTFWQTRYLSNYITIIMIIAKKQKNECFYKSLEKLVKIEDKKLSFCFWKILVIGTCILEKENKFYMKTGTAVKVKLLYFGVAYTQQKLWFYEKLAIKQLYRNKDIRLPIH